MGEDSWNKICMWFHRLGSTSFRLIKINRPTMTTFKLNIQGSSGKESACNAGDASLIPGSVRSPGERNGNSLWHCGKSYGQRSLVGYSPWGCKELDMSKLWEMVKDREVWYAVVSPWGRKETATTVTKWLFSSWVWVWVWQWWWRWPGSPGINHSWLGFQ